MNCLLVVNKMSGNTAKIDEQQLISKYAPDDDVRIVYLRHTDDVYDTANIQKLIVCGGDGTLNHAINLCQNQAIDIYYKPCGTFNETAKDKTGKGILHIAKLGDIGGTRFSYVAAAGSFTDIGASANEKHHFKILAYFSKVLAAYKVHHIPAKISINGIELEDTYTLLMVSNSHRCFGFRFNHLHHEAGDEMELITIKAPKRKGLLGKIKMFFPFFRVFFLGFRKPRISKTINFIPFKEASLTLKRETKFCIDGESVNLTNTLTIKKTPTASKVLLIKD